MTRTINNQGTQSGESAEKALFTAGQVIDGKWVLMECIGKGGMGEVYRAHQLNLKRDVAIKVISAELLRDSQEVPAEISNAVGRFQREVQTMASVRHPNILQIYDYGSIPAREPSAGLPLQYIAMEYVPGDTFRFTMSEEGFDTETDLLFDWLRHYFLPVLEGVEAIHGHGIVHRDIKPENILMDRETPKIVDFGLARSFQVRAVSNSWDVKGTMTYMAPEQFEDFRKAGPEADVYSLGKILFESVAGRMDPKTVPFRAAGLPTAETPLLQRIDAIIRKATHEDKRRRFGSVAELRLAILETLEIFDAEVADQKAPARHTRWMRAGILAAILAVLGMTVYHLYGWLATDRPPVGAKIVTKPEATVFLPSADGPPSPTLMAADGRTMELIAAAGEAEAFYSDRTPVTFHHFVEFLNLMAGELSVSEGIIKKGEDIWLYMGGGSEPYEQIIYEHGRFLLRDAAWAGRPVVRVTWLGVRAYAAFYGKAVPSYAQWRAALSQIGSDAPTPSVDSAPQADPHAQMMGDAQSSAESAFRPPATQEAVAEWVSFIPSNGSAGNPDSSISTVQSHVADPDDPLMLAGRKAPQLRYPWEGFANVGFRTVISLKDLSSRF